MCFIPFLFLHTIELPGPRTGVRAAGALFLTQFAHFPRLNLKAVNEYIDGF